MTARWSCDLYGGFPAEICANLCYGCAYLAYLAHSAYSEISNLRVFNSWLVVPCYKT